MSTAHATQPFLNDLHTGTTLEAIYAFNMYPAFDSLPQSTLGRFLNAWGRNPSYCH